MTTTTTTDAQKAVLDLAEARSGGFAYAFGFAWGILTAEQKATLERYALEILAEIKE
jgi:hypothetical protein